MSWTRLVVELDVDGDRESAETALNRPLEDLFDNGNVIAMSVDYQLTHPDECDGDLRTCTCKREATA